MGKHRNFGAATPGPVTPTRDKADGAKVGRVTAVQGIESPGSDPTDVACKAVIVMMAQAAMAGCNLHPIEGRGFLLSRRGLSEELLCLRAVGDLLRQIGGAR